MRVLVVDDYEQVRNTVVQGLKEVGFAVDSAADGQEGLWYAESFDYDVIVLDLMLPKVDGMQILSKIVGTKKNTRVLLLTAKDRLEDRVDGLDAGADDYLVKPFELDELVARVRVLVRRKYDQNSVIQVADLVIDTVRRKTRRGDRDIELTAREYALLEYLASRAGEVVTRTDIWEHVYDFNSSATSNVVDVYIGYLRKKIEAPHLDRLIHTRYGQGFVLGAKS